MKIDYINNMKGLPEDLFSESIPELREPFFLKLLTSNHYAALLIDETGRVLWVANRTTHKYSDFLGSLQDRPVSDCYQVRFDADPARPGFGAGAFSFPSRNLAEKRQTNHPFWMVYPMSNIRFYALPEKRFLGLVSFSSFFHEFMLFREPPMLLTDENRNITGINNSLAAFLGLHEPARLLGTPAEKAVAWNRPLAPGVPHGAELPVFARWSAGQGEMPLKTLSTSMRLSYGPEAMLLENTSEGTLGFASWKTPFLSDSGVSEVLIEYDAEKGGPPGIAFGGRPSAGDLPDAVSYSLIPDPYNPVLHLKRATDLMMKIPLPEPGANKASVLAFRRAGLCFSVSLDGKPLGTWQDLEPMKTQPQDRLYLYLRPGKRCWVRSVTLRRDKAAVPGEQAPLTAAVVAGKKELHFNVTLQQRAIEDHNVLMYQFKDVTELAQDIVSLKGERDRLAVMLRREDDFLGNSAAVRSMLDMLPALSASGMAVLVEGETGTGKEVLSRMIHRMSPRAKMPFVKVDCSAMPESLMESELFGHEKGAFTGAHERRIGRFEEAGDGTVFLDEIANLSLAIQGKLLNVLQDLKIRRVGGKNDIALDIRIIAASNRPLKTLIEEGRFREDLFYRLNQFRISLPPLRNRREDIPLLAEAFRSEAATLYKKTITGFAPDALEKLAAFDWPGNARELRNVIMRAVMLSRQGTLSATDFALEAPPAPQKGRRGGLRRKLDLPQERLSAILRETGGNMARAAKRLSVSRVALYKTVAKYGLEPQAFRG